MFEFVNSGEISVGEVVEITGLTCTRRNLFEFRCFLFDLCLIKKNLEF